MDSLLPGPIKDPSLSGVLVAFALGSPAPVVQPPNEPAPSVGQGNLSSSLAPNSPLGAPLQGELLSGFWADAPGMGCG